MLEGELSAINDRYAEVESKHLGKINEGLRKAGLPEITWPPQGGMPPMADVSSADGVEGGISRPKPFYRHPLSGLRLWH